MNQNECRCKEIDNLSNELLHTQRKSSSNYCDFLNIISKSVVGSAAFLGKFSQEEVTFLSGEVKLSVEKTDCSITWVTPRKI